MHDDVTRRQPSKENSRKFSYKFLPVMFMIIFYMQWIQITMHADSL